jgi:membrane protease YdiL (CAAX protease family)
MQFTTVGARALIKNNNISLFFILTLLIGWSPWLTGRGYIIFAAPTIAAIIVTILVDGKNGLKAIWNRLGTWRASPTSYIAALLLPALTSGIALGVHALLGGKLPSFPLFSNPMMLVMTFVMFLLPWQSSAFMEEVGFRGYALEELQKKWGPLKGTLVLGIFFGAWLLPEFYRIGSAQNALGVGYYPWFIVTEIGFSLMMTWVYNRSGKSSLISGVLMHVAMNFWPFVMLTNIVPGQPLPAFDQRLWIITSVVVLVSGIAAVVLTKGKLGYKKERAEAWKEKKC